MNITITIDNTPTTESAMAIKEELRRNRVKLAKLCKDGNISHLYTQFQGWLAGKPNQKHSGTFIDVLKKAEIVSEVTKEKY